MTNTIRTTALALAVLAAAPQAGIAQQLPPPSAEALARIPTTVPGPSGASIELTLEQRTAMARREEIDALLSGAKPNQQVNARALDALDDSQLRAIAAELDRITGNTGGATGIPVGPRRDRWELAWQSGRLARDSAYLPESRIPEGKAVEAVLFYRPASGPGESWPETLLPNISPPIESGATRSPIPMLFEMRVDAKADGAMEVAILASMGGKKVLVPGIKLKSGEIASVSVPGGHVLSLHAALRDQTATEKAAMQRLASAQGQDAISSIRAELFSFGRQPEPMKAALRLETAARTVGGKS